MTESSRCAVVVVNCNGGEWVVRCVASVLSKAPTSASEIVVVDNASTDGSREALDERFRGAPLRILAKPRNVGFGAACNEGAAAARSEFVLFLNSDCEFVEDALALPLSLLSTRGDAGALFCRLLNADGTLQPSINPSYPGAAGVLTDALGWAQIKHALFRTARLKRLLLQTVLRRHASARPIAWGGGNYMLVRRSAFDAVGGFDQEFFMYYEDADLCKRLNEAGWTCLYDPRVSVVHHWARSVPTEGISPLLENFRSRLHFFRKHDARHMPVVRAALAFEVLSRRFLLAGLSAFSGRPRWRRAQKAYADVWKWFVSAA